MAWCVVGREMISFTLQWSWRPLSVGLLIQNYWCGRPLHHSSVSDNHLFRHHHPSTPHRAGESTKCLALDHQIDLDYTPMISWLCQGLWDFRPLWSLMIAALKTSIRLYHIQSMGLTKIFPFNYGFHHFNLWTGVSNGVIGAGLIHTFECLKMDFQYQYHTMCRCNFFWTICDIR